MDGQIIKRRTPEEREVERKREELAVLRSTLAERELELADMRSSLAVFEGRYLRQVGSLYAELDEWKARTRRLEAECRPSAAATARAEEASEQARRAYSEAHGTASETKDFTPSPELRNLFREIAKRIHPDLARDSADEERRTRFMADANRAYQSGDSETLRRILTEFEDGSEVVVGDGIGAELIRLIRQISLAKDRIVAIEGVLELLLKGEIAQLRKQSEAAEQVGRDLLAELADSVQREIQNARDEYEKLAVQESSPA